MFRSIRGFSTVAQAYNAAAAAAAANAAMVASIVGRSQNMQKYTGAGAFVPVSFKDRNGESSTINLAFVKRIDISQVDPKMADIFKSKDDVTKWKATIHYIDGQYTWWDATKREELPKFLLQLVDETLT